MVWPLVWAILCSLLLPHPCDALEITVKVTDLLSGALYGDDLDSLVASILPNPTPTNMRNLHRLVQFPDYDFARHLSAQRSLPIAYLQVALNLPRGMLPLRPLLKSDIGRRWFLTHLSELEGPIGSDDLRLRSFSPAQQVIILNHIYHHQTEHRASAHWCLDLSVPEEIGRGQVMAEFEDESRARGSAADDENEPSRQRWDQSNVIPLLVEPNLWLLYDAPCHVLRQRHDRPALSALVLFIESLAEGLPATASSYDDGEKVRVDPRTQLLARLRSALITGTNLRALHMARGYVKVRRIPKSPLEVALRYLMGGGERSSGNISQISQVWETLVEALEKVIGEERILLVAIKFELMAYMLSLFPTLHDTLITVLEERLLNIYAPTEVSAYAVRQVLAPLKRLPRLPRAWRTHIAERLLPVLRLPLAGRTLNSWGARASWWRKNMLGVRLRVNRTAWNSRAMIYVNDPPYIHADLSLVEFGEEDIIEGDNKKASGGNNEIRENKEGNKRRCQSKSETKVGYEGEVKEVRFACLNEGRVIDGIASLWWERMADFARGQRPRPPRLPQALLPLMRKSNLKASTLEKLELDGTVASPLSVHHLCIPGTSSGVALRKIIRALYMIYYGLQLEPYGLL